MADTDFAEPNTDAYRAAVAVYNLASTPSPHSAFIARDIDGVRRSVLAAAAARAHLVPITTGHAAGMLTKDPDVRLIRTALHEPVEVDLVAGTVKFAAGALWSEIAAAAERQGLVVPHGSSGTVGAVGYLLGGGASFYGRLLGTAANHLLSLRIVTADGQERTVSAEQDPDLFWALRGGGGGFGVVTGGTLRAFPATRVFTGMTVWALDETERILTGWREWSQHAPREISTSLRVLHLPPTPGVSPEMTAGPVVVVDGVVLPPDGDLDRARTIANELLDPLRAAAVPLLDTWHAAPPTDALLTHGDPPQPVPSAGDTFCIDIFDAAAAAAWARLVGPGSDSTILWAELRQLGGAFRESSPTGGVHDHLDADVAAYLVDVLPDPGARERAETTFSTIRAGMSPWIGPWTVPTLVEQAAQPQRSFPEADEPRIAAIRRRVDPHGVFALDVRAAVDASTERAAARP